MSKTIGLKMAKASDNDLDMAMDLANAIDTFESNFFPAKCDSGDDEFFDIDYPEHCQRAMEFLLEINGRGSLSRVVFGMATILNPANNLVDPELDHLEPHPAINKAIEQRNELLAALKSLNYAASKDSPNAKIVADILAKSEYQ